MRQINIQTFEGVVCIMVPENITRESIDVLIEVLQMQKVVFPASEENRARLAQEGPKSDGD